MATSYLRNLFAGQLRRRFGFGRVSWPKLEKLHVLALHPDEGKAVGVRHFDGFVSDMRQEIHGEGCAGARPVQIRCDSAGSKRGLADSEAGRRYPRRAIEPQLALTECQAGIPCKIGGRCRLQNIMDEAVAAMLAVFDKYTIADIAAPGNAALLRLLRAQAVNSPPP